ncbi:MAG: IS1595 family transposase [Fimbriimonadaceae bacterium]
MKPAEIKFPKTLLEATKLFSDEENAWLFAVNLRWPNGPVCPFCQGMEHSFLSTRRTWQCKTCSKQFSVKKGSIFEDSPLPLEKWLIGMWLICNAKNGISSYEIHRSLGITQKSAWFLLHRIRLAMQNGSIEKLGGHVEADETYIGGKAHNMHKQKKAKVQTRIGGMGKVIVMGFMERGGAVKTKIIAQNHTKAISTEVLGNVEKGSILYTDALASYRNMGEFFKHYVIDHAVSYVDGFTHTNNMECYWSLLKRTLRGTYISVEPFHMHAYLDEQAFRFNERRLNDGQRFVTLSSQVAGKRITYKELTGKVSTTPAIQR